MVFKYTKQNEASLRKSFSNLAKLALVRSCSGEYFVHCYFISPTHSIALNTASVPICLGQGVVLERSPYSDFVFVNAMRVKNYIGHECRFLQTATLI